MSLPSAPGRGRKPPLPAGSYTTSVRTTYVNERIYYYVYYLVMTIWH